MTFWREAFAEKKKNPIPRDIANLSLDQRNILIERQHLFVSYEPRIHGNHMNFIRFILGLSETVEPGATLLSPD